MLSAETAFSEPKEFGSRVIMFKGFDE